jgi:epsilon-lactone hydrolase
MRKLWAQLKFFVSLVGLVVLTCVRRLFRGAKHPDWRLTDEIAAEIARYVFRSTDRGKMRRIQRPTPVLGALRALVAWERGTLGGQPAEIHTPKDWKEGDSVIYYIHGGGYILCNPGTHRQLIARLALASKARCVAIDYRKAPEHAFPAPVDDCVAGYRELLASGVSPSRLVIAGDSAGGALCLALLQRLRAEHIPMPSAAVLLSPWVDIAEQAGTVSGHKLFDYLQPEMLLYAADHYLQGHAASDPLVSPLHAQLAGLPPLLVHTGGAELFFDQNVDFVARARAAGVDVTHEVTPGMVHVFHMFAAVTPVARKAIRSVGKFVSEHTHAATQEAA